MSSYFVFEYKDIVNALTESEVGEFGGFVSMIDSYVSKSGRKDLHFQTEIPFVDIPDLIAKSGGKIVPDDAE